LNIWSSEFLSLGDFSDSDRLEVRGPGPAGENAPAAGKVAADNSMADAAKAERVLRFLRGIILIDTDIY